MDRVLVTGGAGFIGSHLVDLLLDSGAEVLVIDDFRLGKRESLERAGSTGRLTVIDGDIRRPEDLRAVDAFRPDTVFHLAALHFIPYRNAHKQEALDVNVVGLHNVLRALSGAPLKAFVFPSSGAIYGFGDDPWPETAPPRPDEIYGLSKWLGEGVMARFHHDRPKVRTVVARIFNTYGPRETNPHVLPDIMKALGEGKPIELGNLWPKRDLIFVTDTAAALVATVSGGLIEKINRFDIVLPDGWGVVLGARWIGLPVPNRQGNDDICPRVFALSATHGFSNFLFGCSEGTPERAAENLAETFPGLPIAGTLHGYWDVARGHPGHYDTADIDMMVDAINSADADILHVSIPSPMQQTWVWQVADRLSVPVIITGGSYLDHLAERVYWYPAWVTKLRLNWAYRLCREPRRLWKRYTLDLIAFGGMVLWAKWARRSTSRAVDEQA